MTGGVTAASRSCGRTPEVTRACPLSGWVVAEASADEPQERQRRFGDRVGI